MSPEIRASTRFETGPQPDRSIIVDGLSPYHSSDTSIESRHGGFSYYLLSRNEVNHWIEALLPHVNFTMAERIQARRTVEAGLKKLIANPNERMSRNRNKPKHIIRLNFSNEEATHFSEKDRLRFASQKVLNETFLKILGHGALEDWDPPSKKEFVEKIRSKTAPRRKST